MAEELISGRVRVRRGAELGRYDRVTVEAALDRGLMAHVAFVDDGVPYCIPMLYARVGDEIYIHGSTGSRAVRTLARGGPACLTVTRLDGLVLARSVFEHTANYESVVVLGAFHVVEGAGERLAAFEAFTEKLLPRRWSEARAPSRNTISARNPLDFPCPGRAIRCLITPPPRSAAINPRSAFRIDSQSTPSPMPAFFAKRMNALFVNIRTYAHLNCLLLPGIQYNTECYRWRWPRPGAPHGAASPVLRGRIVQ